MDYSELEQARRALSHQLFGARHDLFASAYRQLQQQLKHYPATWGNHVSYPITWQGVYACGNIRVHECYISIRGSE